MTHNYIHQYITECILYICKTLERIAANQQVGGKLYLFKHYNLKALHLCTNQCQLQLLPIHGGWGVTQDSLLARASSWLANNYYYDGKISATSPGVGKEVGGGGGEGRQLNDSCITLRMSFSSVPLPGPSSTSWQFDGWSLLIQSESTHTANN